MKICRVFSTDGYAIPDHKIDTNKNAALVSGVFENLERETRLELATPTLARSCSTN